MAVSPQEHAAHTANIGTVRKSFGLGAVKGALASIGNNIATNATNIKNNAQKFAADIHQNGVHPFELSSIARGNVKP